MAQIHHLRRSPPPRRPKMTCGTLALVAFLAGGAAAFLSLYMPALAGLKTLIGLAVAIGGYAAFYDRCR
ncbi:hypothetical protein [Azospirillum sp. ST 5-10]|uniref:hypothetical protein n=1 Tax=unclassified Azospirillum TaxID=2630922 RepID=UPI003F4A128B